MARHTDTIAALATPSGTAALALLRVSGPDSSALAAAVLGKTPPPRTAAHADYRGRAGIVLDDVVATYFAGPHSYTGEDSLELSCHGSPFIVQRILEDLFSRGCRPASPGEFTQRAFLNGRMDLSQAEAVMDLISARSERSLAAAREVMQGALSRHLAAIVDEILGSLATVEAYIDFPDEDLPPEDRRRLAERVSSIMQETGRLLATERTGTLLREGISTVLLGEPNAGKSSLFNRILGRDRAIVSADPGTTRDFLEARVNVGPHGLRLVDTAGLNPGAEGVEALGVAKTIESAASADLLILVLDAGRQARPLTQALSARITNANTVVALNKMDLLGGGRPRALAPAGLPSVGVSARTGEGLEALLAEIARLADGMQQTVGEERIAINARHAHYLSQANACLSSAAASIGNRGPSELLASDLRGALAAIGEISGKVDNERMLDQLFASFCIGK
jgi:tRNA modification GTPase